LPSPLRLRVTPSVVPPAYQPVSKIEDTVLASSKISPMLKNEKAGPKGPANKSGSGGVMCAIPTAFNRIGLN